MVATTDRSQKYPWSRPTSSFRLLQGESGGVFPFSAFAQWCHSSDNAAMEIMTAFTCRPFSSHYSQTWTFRGKPTTALRTPALPCSCTGSTWSWAVEAGQMKWGRSWRDSTKKAGSWIGKSLILMRQMVKVAPTRHRHNANEESLGFSLRSSCLTGSCVTGVTISRLPLQVLQCFPLWWGSELCFGTLFTGGFGPVTVEFASTIVLWTILRKVSLVNSSSLFASLSQLIVKLLDQGKLCVFLDIYHFFRTKEKIFFLMFL